jgi:hypothetical protein
MDQSILDSIKKLLGLDSGYTAFDTDIIMHINSVFSILHQIGASPVEGFVITDNSSKWEDFIANAMHVEMVKSYMYMKVRLMFDPPTTSFAITAMQEQIKEFEFRLNVLEIQFNPHAFDHLLVDVIVDDEDDVVVVLTTPPPIEPEPDPFPIYFTGDTNG